MPAKRALTLEPSRRTQFPRLLPLPLLSPHLLLLLSFNPWLLPLLRFNLPLLFNLLSNILCHRLPFKCKASPCSLPSPNHIQWLPFHRTPGLLRIFNHISESTMGTCHQCSLKTLFPATPLDPVWVSRTFRRTHKTLTSFIQWPAHIS